MDALELIQLGRQLTKVGEEALRGSRSPGLPNGPSLVLRDVFANRDSSIGEIAGRTGLPQSYVSESVASLQQQGLVETRTHVNDRRRTLVRVSAHHRSTVARKAATPIDAALAKALRNGADEVGEVIECLHKLAERLRPPAAGPIIDQIRPARGARGERGAQGERGARGERGERGERGDRGERGESHA